MNTYSVNQDLLVAILNYLASKPYGEVYQLVASIQQLTPEVKMEIGADD